MPRQIRTTTSFLVALLALACGGNKPTRQPEAKRVVSPPDSVSAVSRALKKIAPDSGGQELLVALFYAERDGFLIRFVDTRPDIHDGTILVWVSRRGEVIVLEVG